MEAFLGLVAEKIVVALGSEALNSIGYVLKGQGLQQSEVNEMMRRIRSEFEHMQTFISNVDLQKYSTTIEPWVKRAREIADGMEDVIDLYLYLSAQQSQAATLYYYTFPFDRCYILSSNPWSDIDTRLKKIESALAHLKEMKERYDITKLESGEAGSSATPEVAAGRKAFNPASLDIAHEDDTTLFAPQRNSLIKWLTDGKAKRAVIVVSGMGGLGKTTLVENVYYSKEIDTHFDCKAWVTVSTKCDKNELLIRLLKELLGKKAEHSSYALAWPSLIEKVHNFLQEKKYLLVLDDVWTLSAFTDLENIIHEDANGSRVVITTRSHDIADALANTDSVASLVRKMQLSKLDPNQAWHLFCWKAFRKEESACPPKLEDIGQSIVDKCDGLPLAIVAIARVMSLKRKTVAEWKRVLDSTNSAGSSTTTPAWKA